MLTNLEKMLEYCRLCQVNPGSIQFINDDVFIAQVFEYTKVKINSDQMHLLPKTVCSSCKLSIEEFFAFAQEIRLVDQKLQQQILETKTLQCDKKVFDLPNHELVKEKIKTVDSSRHKCPVCIKTYTRYKNLQLHKRSHLNLYCSNCDIIFDDVLARKNHKCNASQKYKVNESCDVPVVESKTNVDACERKVDPNLLHIIKNKEQDKEWFEDEFPINSTEVKIEDSVKVAGDNVTDTCIERLNEVNVNLNRKSKPRGSYTCEACNEKFVTNSDLRAHHKIHGATFSCTFENCKKVCTSAYTLRTHLMRHEGKMPFLCVTCGKGFTTKNSLNCHEKTHAKIKGYACKECNIGFSVASNLRAHQKKHHEGVRFYCSQCTRAFITKCSLERHELVHTGVKEFKCGSCRAAFYTNKELLKHQRYHQGLRLYKCDQCFKTFFEKHHLTIHIRVHTGERPYACKVVGCGKSFTESQKLSRHIKARHPPV